MILNCVCITHADLFYLANSPVRQWSLTLSAAKGGLMVALKTLIEVFTSQPPSPKQGSTVGVAEFF